MTKLSSRGGGNRLAKFTRPFKGFGLYQRCARACSLRGPERRALAGLRRRASWSGARSLHRYDHRQRSGPRRPCGIRHNLRAQLHRRGVRRHKRRTFARGRGERAHRSLCRRGPREICRMEGRYVPRKRLLHLRRRTEHQAIGQYLRGQQHRSARDVEAFRDLDPTGAARRQAVRARGAACRRQRVLHQQRGGTVLQRDVWLARHCRRGHSAGRPRLPVGDAGHQRQVRAERDANGPRCCLQRQPGGPRCGRSAAVP